MADTITRIVPQDGWSPIICRRVPTQQTITDIVGDKGANAIYEGGSIKNFHAKIDWQDQYSGSRVPSDIITESSDDYGETWTMNEVEEHGEGSFELDYEGHERDFEVRINKGEDSKDIPFCFPSEPNEQVEELKFYFLPTPSEEFTYGDGAFQIHIGECNVGDSADDCLSCLTFTEDDKEGTGLDRVGEGWVDGDTSLITSGVPVYYVRTEWVDDYTWQIIAEVQQIVSSSGGSDPSLYIRYRWQMNGQEITDTDGSFEHAITVTDYPVKLVVDAHYSDNFGGHEIGAPIFNSAKIFYKSGTVDDTKTRGAFTKPVQATLWADKGGWQSQTWSYTENGHTVTAQVGANITALRDVKIEASLGEDSPFKFFDAYTDEGDTYYFYLIVTPPSRFIHPDEEDDDIPTATYRLTGETMGDQLRFAMLGDDRYENLGLKGKWFTYTFTSNELDDKTAYWTDLNGDDEDMVGSNLSSLIFKEGTVVTKDDLTVTMTRNDGSVYEATDYWMPNNYALGRNKQSVTVQKGSLSTTLPVTVAYSTKVEVGNIDVNIITISEKESGEVISYALKVEAPPEGTFTDLEGGYCTNNQYVVVYKGDYEVFSDFDFSEPLNPYDYYLICLEKSVLKRSYNYLDENEEDSGLPVIPIGGGDFIKSSFYEYGEYVEPDHYKAYYECYDGTEGFEEVAEIDNNWSSNLHRIEGYLEFYSKTNEATCRIYEIKGLQEEYYDSDMKCYTVSTEDDNWLYLWDGEHCNYRVPEISVSEEDGIGYYALLIEEENYYDMVNSGASYDGQLYYLDEEGDKGEPLPIPPLSEIPRAVEPLCGEYGSEVGTLTLGKKSYLYRVGLEPIDEENYLFIKDFKDIPFNYGLVNCYEPQWEEPVRDSVVYLGNIEEMNSYLYKLPSPPDNLIQSSEGITYAPLYVTTESGVNYGTAVLTTEELIGAFESYGLPVSEGDWTMTSSSLLDLDHLELAYDQENPFYSKGIDHSEAEEEDGDDEGWGTPVLTVDRGEDGKVVAFEIVTATDAPSFGGTYLATPSDERDEEGYLKSMVQMFPKSWFVSQGYDVTSIEEGKFYALLLMKDGKIYDTMGDNELKSPVLYYVDPMTETVTNIQVEFV